MKQISNSTKRIIVLALAGLLALLMVVVVVLTSCEKKQSANQPTDASTEATQQIQTEDTQDSTGAKDAVSFRHPLTGVPLEQPWSGQLTAVVINNLKKAMPQRGISKADIFYEVEVEGDITRCLAVFSDFTDVDVIGPIRSARTYFSSLAVSYDAPLVHCGGSPGLALAGRYGASGDTIDNWEHIDQGANGQYFYRDMDRYSSGYAYEHTLFTTGEKLQKAMEANGYNTPDSKSFGLLFDEGVTLNGQTANEVTVKFKGGKTTTFTFDTEKQLYKMYQHGQDHIDGNTNEVVTFKNVIAIYTNQTYHSDGYHKFYDTIGSGEGYAAINGQIVPIKWSRESLRTNYTYTLADGTPLTLDVGTTYIALVGIKHDIAYK
ncbi:MAG: DUF3048 domain-containing protein [Oscillospiraceae bacterium]|nr:DUF3048 domain-containing protein [Oscillospiraceae bacterium]